jgi:hypothetical protein
MATVRIETFVGTPFTASLPGRSFAAPELETALAGEGGRVEDRAIHDALMHEPLKSGAEGLHASRPSWWLQILWQAADSLQRRPNDLRA